jgi:hypothetical protein
MSDEIEPQTGTPIRQGGVNRRDRIRTHSDSSAEREHRRIGVQIARGLLEVGQRSISAFQAERSVNCARTFEPVFAFTEDPVSQRCARLFNQ